MLHQHLLLLRITIRAQAVQLARARGYTVLTADRWCGPGARGISSLIWKIARLGPGTWKSPRQYEIQLSYFILEM